LSLNSNDPDLKTIFQSSASQLINRVDPETGEVLYLEGNPDEILKARNEFFRRVAKLNTFLIRRRNK